ncbi:hypothetical protein [Streptomyces pristinaespiralis]|uniref:hypothetical protein n=1 Tax=Streptomyces pristinaespiralis TaxID=38300 RepID=UPI003835F3B9
MPAGIEVVELVDPVEDVTDELLQEPCAGRRGPVVLTPTSVPPPGALLHETGSLARLPL